VLFGKEQKSPPDINEQGKKDKVNSKKVSKRIGEYIDYEEIKREKPE
jgi:hypothetical protein